MQCTNADAEQGVESNMRPLTGLFSPHVCLDVPEAEQPEEQHIFLPEDGPPKQHCAKKGARGGPLRFTLR